MSSERCYNRAARLQEDKMKLNLTLVLLFALAVALVVSCGSAPQIDIEPPPTEGVDGYSGASPASPDGGTEAASADTAAEPAPDAGTESQ
jgi:hypothetical protein